MSSTKVRFVESESGVLSLLEIETTRRRALFPKIAAALFVLRVQIVRAESRVSRCSRVERLAVVELDGAPIGERRRLAIQSEILSAIDSSEVAPRRATSPLAVTERARPAFVREKRGPLNRLVVVTLVSPARHPRQATSRGRRWVLFQSPTFDRFGAGRR